MKLLKNKVFITIITIIFLLFSLQFYFISNSYKRDTHSYVILIEWAGTLSQWNEKQVLALNIKKQVQNGDIISTLKNSLAIIEWGDKSITRLWWSTKIQIKENFVSEDLSKINVSFELLKWQTWSNVISILTWESHFSEEIKWISAGVRGTVFEANYDKDYLIVHNHEVNITNKEWDTKKLYPGKIFSISTFWLEEMLIKIDGAFSQLNETLDVEYLQKLRTDFLLSMKKSNPFTLIQNLFNTDTKIYGMLISQKDTTTIDRYIQTLPKEKQETVLQKIKTFNQLINFENGENSDLYNLKVNTRTVLLKNSNDKEYNETLVKYSVYDLTDILWFKNFNVDVTQKTFLFLSQNKKYLTNVKKSLQGGSYNILDNIDVTNFSMESMKKRLLELNAKWQEIIHTGLNKLLEFYKK